MLVKFIKDKETKNTVRFVAPMGGAVAGSIYIQKGVDLAKRGEIVVSVEVEEKVAVTA